MRQGVIFTDNLRDIETNILSCSPELVNEIIIHKYGQFLFAACFHASFLLGLFFDPEDGSECFFFDTSVDFSTDYAALCPRRQNSS
jgi:hypothetical protein